MPTILIHGGDQQKRREAVLNLLTDQGIIKEEADLIKMGTSCFAMGEEGGKIGIKEVKTVLPHLYVRVAGKQKAVIISEAQRLTTAAQNALLKTLEEPPAHLFIIITVPNAKLLLPTVVSRCLRIEVKGGEIEPQKELIEEIFATRGGRRVALFEEKIGYNQDHALAFLNEVEAYFHSKITSEASIKESLNSRNAQSLIKLWRAKKLLRDESANIKLIVDELLLSW